MRKALYVSIALFMCGCTAEDKNDEVQHTEQQQTHDLVVVDGNKYTEYYEGEGNRIKFEGYQDEQKRRHGKWMHYSESGTELSMTMYEHGKKHGHSVVRYPNGATYYYGEYQNDTMVGIWKTFDQNGKLLTEKDYGYPAE